MKMVRVSVLAVIAFLGSLAVADAQSGGYQGTTKSETGTEISLGWNYVHATYCMDFSGYLYVVAADGSYYFTNNASDIATLTPACQTGNWIAFNVISLTPAIVWNAVLVFPFK